MIVDEIHAVARDKRGSHLALTLERLDALAEHRPQRIGLSATQRPIETIARLLVGAGEGRTRPDGQLACRIVDLGHRRDLDLTIELPDSELEAVASTSSGARSWTASRRTCEAHRTTLIFVNTRRLAERVAHLLGERLGEGQVAAHHGSLSKDRRLRLEARLRAGSSPRWSPPRRSSWASTSAPSSSSVRSARPGASPRCSSAWADRATRAAPSPKGRLYPTTRDELVEATALLRAVRGGPARPRPAAARPARRRWRSRSWPPALPTRGPRTSSLRWSGAPRPTPDLARRDFDAVVAMLADGIQTGRGRRGAYLHRDRVHGVLRGRRARASPP